MAKIKSLVDNGASVFRLNKNCDDAAETEFKRLLFKKSTDVAALHLLMETRTKRIV